VAIESVLPKKGLQLVSRSKSPSGADFVLWSHIFDHPSFLFAWANVYKQGVVTKKLELMEAAGSSSSFFFQNLTHVALLSVDVIHFCVQL
jgi:hypothetical protein